MLKETTRKFPLGEVVYTASLRVALLNEYRLQVRKHGWSSLVSDATEEMFLHEAITEILGFHESGNWGDVCAEDAEANDRAILRGERILSSYKVLGIEIWIITEWDRSYTTILQPVDY